MLDLVKDQMLHVRIDERDRERLDAIAAHFEMSAGAVVRMLIRKAADEIEAPEPKKSAPKK
jgi:antitoxin component of RelBE/YafQ-DinJ toxin-antitoxin module